MFGNSASFLIDDNSSFKSVFGAIVSILVFFVIAFYGLNKALVFAERGDTTHINYTVYDELPQEKTFEFADINFNVRLTFWNKVWTDFGKVAFPILDELIEVHAYQFVIASDFTGVKLDRIELKTRRCTAEDAKTMKKLNPL